MKNSKITTLLILAATLLSSTDAAWAGYKGGYVNEAETVANYNAQLAKAAEAEARRKAQEQKPDTPPAPPPGPPPLPP